jgi:catechol 2,3-dioxygenase-like lactoylglutathione lyase family enzyme
MTSQRPIVTGVDFISLPTSHFPDALRFYTEVLGLECSASYSSERGGEFQTGNLTLQLLNSEALGVSLSPGTHPVALHVEDVDEARSELERRGVDFSGETLDTGVCRMAFFEDPDGNALVLHHRYAPR